MKATTISNHWIDRLLARTEERESSCATELLILCHRAGDQPSATCATPWRRGVRLGNILCHISTSAAHPQDHPYR